MEMDIMNPPYRRSVIQCWLLRLYDSINRARTGPMQVRRYNSYPCMYGREK